MVADKVTVTEQEISRFLESNNKQVNTDVTYHLFHILIASPEDIQESKEKADTIYQQIIDGEDFKDMAIRHSSGSNALNGGDLGNRKANELPQIFLDAIKGLNQGDVSKPVKSASGFHILKLASSSSSNEMVTQTRARHILIKTNPDVTDEDARNTLAQLRQRIIDGEDFADLANEYSEDPGSKIKGGDLGRASPGMFVPAFERVMNSLEINALSEPFQSQFGWHLMQVLERKEIDMTSTLQEAKARQAISKRKIDEELRLWLRKILNEAYVEYVDKTLKPDQ